MPGPIALLPDPVQITIAVPEPTITIQPPATVLTPDPVAFTIAIPEPTVAVGFVLTPDPVMILLSIPTPRVYKSLRHLTAQNWFEFGGF